ncbi:hypothetical protein EL18_01291 [Nitratireductor basaltis]|uniref:Uncharacterized protein n=2 Tax=Nitratireductor basaltis TaxID=472175 RepID=A0A084UBC4_9HYPH|nr:hypothetical protein EL18_01291 [Nitratireductor basaltis]
MNDPAGEYVCVQDESGSWSVVDSRTGEVAQIDNNRLVRLPLQRAEAVRRTLTQIRRNSLGRAKIRN